MHSIQPGLWPFVVMGVLFVVVGVSTFIKIVLGLLTGGPRALQLPGAPRLYDCVYYLLHLVGLTGWAFGLMSFFHGVEGGGVSGFMIGWGVCAVGIGSLFVLRGDMIAKAMAYKAEHGFWLWRFFYRQQAERMRAMGWFQKALGGVFVVIGIGVLIFNVPYLPAAIAEFRANLKDIAAVVTGGNGKDH